MSAMITPLSRGCYHYFLGSQHCPDQWPYTSSEMLSSPHSIEEAVLKRHDISKTLRQQRRHNSAYLNLQLRRNNIFDNDHIESRGRAIQIFNVLRLIVNSCRIALLERRRRRARSDFRLCTPVEHNDRRRGYPKGIPQCSCPVLRRTRRRFMFWRCESNILERPRSTVKPVREREWVLFVWKIVVYMRIASNSLRYSSEISIFWHAEEDNLIDSNIAMIVRE